MSPDINQFNESTVFSFNNFNTNNNNKQNQQKLNQLLIEMNELIDNKSNNITIDRESRRLLIDLLRKYLNNCGQKFAENNSSLKAVIILNIIYFKYLFSLKFIEKKSLEKQNKNLRKSKKK